MSYSVPRHPDATGRKEETARRKSHPRANKPASIFRCAKCGRGCHSRTLHLQRVRGEGRGRERQTDRHRDRDRETERETETDTERDRQTKTEPEPERETHTQRQTD